METMRAVSIAVTARARTSVPSGSPTRCATTSAWWTATRTAAISATPHRTPSADPTPTASATKNSASDRTGTSQVQMGVRVVMSIEFAGRSYGPRSGARADKHAGAATSASASPRGREELREGLDGFRVFEDADVRILESLHPGCGGLSTRIELASEADRAVAGRVRTPRAAFSPAEVQLKRQVARQRRAVEARQEVASDRDVAPGRNDLGTFRHRAKRFLDAAIGRVEGRIDLEIRWLARSTNLVDGSAAHQSAQAVRDDAHAQVRGRDVGCGGDVLENPRQDDSELVERKAGRVEEDPDLIVRGVESRDQLLEIPGRAVDSVDEHDLDLVEVGFADRKDPPLRTGQESVRLIHAHLSELGGKHGVLDGVDLVRLAIHCDAHRGRRRLRCLQIDRQVGSRNQDPVGGPVGGHEDRGFPGRAGDDLVRLVEAVAVEVGEDEDVVSHGGKEDSVGVGMGGNFMRADEIEPLPVVIEGGHQEIGNDVPRNG